MFSSAASVLLSLGAWSYVPGFVTRHLLSFYYRFLFRGVAAPQPGSALWQTHYRTAYAIAVLAFLSYNLINAARSTPPNFFQVLGITPEANDATLKNAYRGFAKLYHPDRAGPASEPMFMAVRDAYEALKDPVKRFAYERFGPDTLGWRDCSSPKEFIQRGLFQSSGFYIGSTAILFLMSVVKKPSPVAFWRYILLFNLLASELSLVLGYDTWILGVVFPNRVAFQHVLFLHHLFVFLSFALSHVMPVLFPEAPMIRPEDPRTYALLFARLHRAISLADIEVSRMLQLELHAMSNTNPPDFTSISIPATFVGPVTACDPPAAVLSTLVSEMEDMLVEQQVLNEAPLRALWDTAVRREREKQIDRERDHTASSERGSKWITPQPSNSILPVRLLSPPVSEPAVEQPVEQLARAEKRLGEKVDRRNSASHEGPPSPRPSPSPPSARPTLRASSSRSIIRFNVVEKQSRRSTSPEPT